MGVTISEKKNKKMLADIERVIGRQKIQKVSDKALIAGAKVFVRELEQQLETFADTGATVEDTSISEPMWINGSRTVKIHWNGPNGRYRIIHLNEWGTVQNPSPRGKGAIARAMRNSEKAYRDTIMKALKDGL